MAKGLQKLKVKAKDLTHEKEPGKGKKHSALDDCSHVDEVTQPEWEFLTDIADAMSEFAKKVNEDVKTFDDVFASKEFHDLVMLSADNENTAKAIEKNFHTRCLEIQNIYQYFAKFAKFFENAKVVDEDEE